MFLQHSTQEHHQRRKPNTIQNALSNRMIHKRLFFIGGDYTYYIR
jgi:hypothetical protein